MRRRRLWPWSNGSPARARSKSARRPSWINRRKKSRRRSRSPEIRKGCGEGKDFAGVQTGRAATPFAAGNDPPKPEKFTQASTKARATEDTERPHGDGGRAQGVRDFS